MSEEKWDTLLQMIKENNCTPFLGAGACWPTLPLGIEVARELSQKFKYPLADRDNLPRVTQFIAIKKDATALKFEVARNLKNKGIPNFASKDEPHSILAELPFLMYITTNYDDFMFKALALKGKTPIYEYCRWNNYISNLPKNIPDTFEPSTSSPLIYHLHGNFEIPQSIVLTEDDYIEFLVNVAKDLNGKIHHRVLRSLSGTSLMFLGYDLQDISFRSIFKSIVNSLAFGLERTNISVQITPENKHKNLMRREIEVLTNLISDTNLESEISEKITKPLVILQNISKKKDIDKKDKNLLYNKTNLVEKLFNQSSIENFQKQSILNIINILQNEINQISCQDEEKSKEALRFIERYFERLDICIYWGEAMEFAKELLERWKKYSKT